MERNVLLSLTPEEVKKIMTMLTLPTNPAQQGGLANKIQKQMKSYDHVMKYEKEELSIYSIIAALVAEKPLIYADDNHKRWQDSHYIGAGDIDDVMDAHMHYRYVYKFKEA